MDRFHTMQVFVKVAEVGGFAEASRQLNLSAPAVTRAVAELEEKIRTRLFVRTTRTVQLTEAGASFLQDCRRILQELAEAEAAAAGAHTDARGTLTVTAPVLMGQQYVVPIVTELLDNFPDLRVRTLFVDRITNMVDEGIDVGIRVGHLPDSTISAVRVGQVRRVVCGSPAYFAVNPAPVHPRDLARHKIIAATGAWTMPRWDFGGEEKVSVAVEPRLLCNTNAGAIAAALDGWGLVRLLSYQVGPYLKSGGLSAVLTDFEEDPLPVHIVHPEGRRAPAKVRVFIDVATKRLRRDRLLNP